MSFILYNKKCILLLVLSLLNNIAAKAQLAGVKNLEKNITIHAENVTITQLLNELGSKTNVKFSYNPKLIKANKRVTIHSNNQPASAVLDKIFDQKYTFKSRGNYVIISPSTSTSERALKSNEILLSGSIIDDETNDGIAFASIYTSSGNTTLTDETGAFSIRLKEDEKSTIELRKSGYMPLSFDTGKKPNNQLELKMAAAKSLTLLIDDDTLRPLTPTITLKQNFVETIFPISQEFRVNQVNIQDTLHRPATVSLYPGLSTYGKLSSSIVFNFALNFVGYNRGIAGVELGALSNINIENVSNVQLAGLSNYVGGNVNGVQAAGIFNRVKGTVDGVQMAGISNNVKGHVYGVQLSGILNQNDSNAHGLQMAGILNTVDTIRGLQMAGIANICDSISGIQMAGISNHAHHVNGMQMAGIYNGTLSIEGLQLSGLVNHAKKVNGNQIGVFNFADTITGLPIGLFSFVNKNGYKNITLFKDEIFDFNLGFTTGVKKFHTGLYMGAQTTVIDKAASLFTAGFTIGTSQSLSRSIALDIDLSSQWISKRSITTLQSNKYKASIGLDIKILKKISIVGGATINAYNFDRTLLNDPLFSNIRKSYVYSYDKLTSDTIWKAWFGYNVGLRYSI